MLLVYLASLRLISLIVSNYKGSWFRIIIVITSSIVILYIVSLLIRSVYRNSKVFASISLLALRSILLAIRLIKYYLIP